MAKSQKTKKQVKKQTRQQETTQPFSFSNMLYMTFGESYKSLLVGMGVVIVLLAGLILFGRQQSSQVATTQSPTPTPVQTELKKEISAAHTKMESPKQTPKTYTTVSGDSLWTVAEKVYNDGYKWVDIAKANKRENPGVLFSGETLVIPTLAPAQQQQIAQAQVTPAPQVEAQPTMPQDKTYTVQKNDSLWDIAVKEYNDGYKWVDIAKANKLANPGLIFSGDVLQIPR